MIVALRIAPESAQGGEGGWRIQRPRVPREIRADFARVVLTAAAAWAVGAGLFLSVIPSYAADLLKTENLALLGAVTAIILATSCVAQVLVRNGAPPVEAQAGGLGLLALGLLALVLATPLHVVALLIIGAVLAGAGHGLAFLAAQDNLTRIAPEEQRAEVSAAFYVCIYLGYTYGTPDAARSPLTLEELRRLEQAVGLTDEDEPDLRRAGEVLAPQAADMVDAWRAMLAEFPHLASYSAKPDGTPNPE